MKNAWLQRRTAADDRPAGNFRLMRYFVVTSLIAFSAVGVALYLLQRDEEGFFANVQAEQTAFFAQVQSTLARQQHDDAQRGLLAVHEAGHVNLTRLFANVLWSPYFAPFVERAARIPVDHCRSIPTGNQAAADSRGACFEGIGAALRALPEFAALDERSEAMMRNSAVFKIKVFDLRGLTVYSSEHSQIGEDKADNVGWQSAVAGKPASELTHRDRFSAFERVVENRDLISSYIPVRAPGNDRIVGVFEIYSDVTPLLAQLRTAAANIDALTSANQKRVEQVARDNERKVRASSKEFLGIVGGLLAVLYIALLMLVRYGQRVIDLHTIAQQRAAAREQFWHGEKMAALAAMAANVSHEVNNALAIISGHAQDVGDRQTRGQAATFRPQVILEQTWRIANMTRRIVDFAAARGDRPELVDVNQMMMSVCDFLRFDRRFAGTQIEFEPGGQLPALMVIPDHLNEALINVLQTFVHDDGGGCRFTRVRVVTEQRDSRIWIRLRAEAAEAVAASGPVSDELREMRIDAARRRLDSIGGVLSVADDSIDVGLPLSSSMQRTASQA